jgi:hypothetical protein
MDVVSIRVGVLSNRQSMSWTESYAPLTIDTILIVATDSISFFIVEVCLIGALVNTNLATYTTRLVSLNSVFRNHVGFHEITPSVFSLIFNLPTTGSPPLGHQNLSRL